MLDSIKQQGGRVKYNLMGKLDMWADSVINPMSANALHLMSKIVWHESKKVNKVGHIRAQYNLMG